MAYNPAIHHRRSIRLPGRDYSRDSAYFVTVAIAGKLCILGNVVDGEIALNENGRIVTEEWRALGTRFDAVYLDAWVVMPNHVHGIVWLRGGGERRGDGRPQGAQQRAPTHSGQVANFAAKPKPLGQIVGAFKTAVSRRINDRDGTVGQSIWQRNYHEHVVRNEAERERIRKYIRDNPGNWEQDPENSLPAGIAESTLGPDV